jgi:predicted O-methyltransferase YrrM
VRLFQSFLIVRVPDLKIELDKLAITESAVFARENFANAMYFENKKCFHDYLMKKVEIRKNSVALEFGVWEGASINAFASKLREIDFYGFDSFEGLEEDWTGFNYQKGTFSTGGKLPKVERNVVLIKGWFEDTLPGFISTNLIDKFVCLVHLDADTITPTKFVLRELEKYLESGTILIFDEFFGYPNWQNHEYAAWVEFCKKSEIRFQYIAYSNIQVAIKII